MGDKGQRLITVQTHDRPIADFGQHGGDRGGTSTQKGRGKLTTSGCRITVIPVPTSSRACNGMGTRSVEKG